MLTSHRRNTLPETSKYLPFPFLGKKEKHRSPLADLYQQSCEITKRYQVEKVKC